MFGMNIRRRLAGLCFLLVAVPGAGKAQQLDVPVVDDCPGSAQIACYATSIVQGLNPNGDGFLAVRSGPGSGFAMIGKLREGDVVEVIEIRGQWYGIREADGRKGWAHGNWLADLAG